MSEASQHNSLVEWNTKGKTINTRLGMQRLNINSEFSQKRSLILVLP